MSVEKKENNCGTWDWMFSDREYEDGETYDVHFLFNKFTGEVKMLITKRIELVSDEKTRLVRNEDE